jgi:hypothetical protein
MQQQQQQCSRRIVVGAAEKKTPRRFRFSSPDLSIFQNRPPIFNNIRRNPLNL